MTQITGARNIIQQEEVSYRSGVTEGTFTRLGATLNFISDFQTDNHSFNLNGRYYTFGTQISPDGIFPVLFNMEIVGYSLFSNTSGVSGISELDVIHLRDGGSTNLGSIFSVTPKVDSSSANNSYSLIDIFNGIDLALPAGHTKAVFSTTEFLAGDVLRMDLISGMVDAENLSLQLIYRPR